jgi:hypothetical protein
MKKSGHRHPFDVLASENTGIKKLTITGWAQRWRFYMYMEEKRGMYAAVVAAAANHLMQDSMSDISWYMYSGIRGERPFWVDAKLWACCEPSFLQKEAGQEPGSSWK